MEAEVSSDETLRSILDLVAGAWRVRLLDGRWLPDIAAELIAAGIDPPSLVELAGLDFAPFDPRDAGDLLVASFEELELPMPNLDKALLTAMVFAAWAVQTSGLLPWFDAEATPGASCLVSWRTVSTRSSSRSALRPVSTVPRR